MRRNDERMMEGQSARIVSKYPHSMCRVDLFRSQDSKLAFLTRQDASHAASIAFCCGSAGCGSSSVPGWSHDLGAKATGSTQVADRTTPLPRSSACMSAHWNPTQAEMILDNGTSAANPGTPPTAPLRNPKKI